MGEKPRVSFVAHFTAGQRYFSWEEAIRIILDNMKKKTWIADNEVCGDISGQYLCVDPELYVIIPITIPPYLIPLQIEILRHEW